MHTPMIPNSIILNHTTVHKDARGNLRLNDLQHAAGLGGRKSKTPNKWLETKTAQNYIEAVEKQTPNSGLAPTVLYKEHGGALPGTYGTVLVALEYARWLDATFGVAVNQFFLDNATSQRPRAFAALMEEWESCHEVIHEKVGTSSRVHAYEQNFIYGIHLGMTAKSYKHHHNLPSDYSVMKHVDDTSRMVMTILFKNSGSLINMGLVTMESRRAALETIHTNLMQGLSGLASPADQETYLLGRGA